MNDINARWYVGSNGRFSAPYRPTQTVKKGETTGGKRHSLQPNPGPVVPPLPHGGLIGYNFVYDPI
jgi:hypothetical protein